jgi:predicted ATP-grasp superfamily ATP-dependent carboligase
MSSLPLPPLSLQDPVCVWFDGAFNNAWSYISDLRQHWKGGPLTVAVSHTDTKAPSMAAADIQLTFSEERSEEERIAWMLEQIERHGIDVIVTRGHLEAIAKHASAFDELGCRLTIVSRNVDYLAALNDKKKSYEVAQELRLPLPYWRTIHPCQHPDPAMAVRAVYDNVREHADAVCVKPTNSIGGMGFAELIDAEHVLPENVFSEYIRPQVRLADIMAIAPSPNVPELMFLEMLPGAEHSIDCIADNGTLLASVTRTKKGRFREIGHREDLVAYATRIIERFELSGPFNVQFLDNAAGESKFLEVNTRLSGGVDQAALAGRDMVRAAVEQSVYGTILELPEVTPCLLRSVPRFVHI